MALGLVLSLLLFGCAGLQLDQFRKHAARGDQAWIADQEIDCPRPSDVCSLLHLIKGDACLQLAEADKAPADHYACAADELGQGLALKPAWENVDAHLHYREKFCESLKRLQELRSDTGTARHPDRFVEAAKALYQLAPNSVPAVYYLARAHLNVIAPTLTDINAATRIPVCSQLKRSLRDVLSVMETAQGQILPGWDRMADRYERLVFDLGVALHQAGCR